MEEEESRLMGTDARSIYGNGQLSIKDQAVLDDCKVAQACWEEVSPGVEKVGASRADSIEKVTFRWCD